MSSNIATIRAAETQVEGLREELKKLNDAALEDGVIDDAEKKEIDRVEGKINTLRHVISLRKKAWEANKADYEKLRSEMATGLENVKRSDNEEMRSDQQKIAQNTTPVDKAAAEEDFGNALRLARELKRLVDLFEKMVENERLEGMTSEELVNTDLTADAIDEVFTDDYMSNMKNIKFKVEGDPELKVKLKDLMDEIKKGFSSGRRPELMQDLEAAVGPPPSAAELDADYTRFLVLKKQRDAIGATKSAGPIDDVDETKHPDFSASREQLLFGKVLGDALGIHEVFASILSPTGGLVGPGNELIPGCIDSPHLSPDNPIALHGTVHDAAGYLKSFHNEGPGYNYRDNPFESVAEDIIGMVDEDLLPVIGQVSGVWYWGNEAGGDYLEARYDEGVVALEQALADARNGAAEKVSELISNIDAAKQNLADAAEAMEEGIKERKEQAEKSLKEAAKKAEAAAIEVVEGFEDAVKKSATGAVEAYEEAAAGARAIGSEAVKKLDAVANFIWS